MTGMQDLSGYRILVVEDNFYIALDEAAAIEQAGGTVQGPCANQDAARQELERAKPSAALVDINLGDGPSFALARLLQEREIPIVFVTGYDKDATGLEFDDVICLQKPVQPDMLIAALVEVLRFARRLY